MQHIQLAAKRPTSPHPVLNLGFRVFFLAASLFAIVTMLRWSHMIFATHLAMGAGDMLPAFWHGHEMIFGYTLAVIAGFLLSAVKTWTGQMMPYGWRLLGIFLPWLLARTLYLTNGIANNGWTRLACAADLLFWLLLMVAVITPIWRVRQQRQIGIVALLVLLLIAQGGFYVALFGGDLLNTQYSLWLGFYMVIGVVLTIGRRVMPMFIENGIAAGQAVTQKVKNSRWLDKLSLLGFFGFVLSDVIVVNVLQQAWATHLTAIFALSVAIANFLRLYNWYLNGLWRKPLVWSLWLALFGMASAFVLYALQAWGLFGVSHSLAMHALAVSGIGLMTLAMMSRVALGHTGRSVHQPIRGIAGAFVLMALAWVFRAILPMLLPTEHYLTSIAMSQVCWLLAFGWYVLSYANILWSPRHDGLFG